MSFFSPSPLPNPAAAEFSTPGQEAKPKAFLEGHLAESSPRQRCEIQPAPRFLCKAKT